MIGFHGDIRNRKKEYKEKGKRKSKKEKVIWMLN